MGRVTLPDTTERRKRIYSMMLDLPEDNKLSEDELVLLCKSRGYVSEDKSSSERNQSDKDVVK